MYSYDIKKMSFNMTKRHIFQSPAFNALADLPCLAIEKFDYYTNRKSMLKGLPRGDGQPVMLIPGFLTDDIGYQSHKWDCGVNWGSSAKRVTAMKDRFEELIKQYPDQKIALVGWSLGGVYARELARSYPDNVSCVITLGAPFGAGLDDTSINPVLKSVYETLNPKSPLSNDEALKAQALMPPPMPTTSIFSKTDGIVNWQASLNPNTDLSENIDVTESSSRGQGVSHTSMRLNKAVITVIADRLKAATQAKSWAAFNANDYPSIVAEQSSSTPKWHKDQAHYQELSSKRSRLFNK
jgi:pimeloyl-ACP methyl ester carboxylesterase